MTAVWHWFNWFDRPWPQIRDGLVFLAFLFVVLLIPSNVYRGTFALGVVMILVAVIFGLFLL